MSSLTPSTQHDQSCRLPLARAGLVAKGILYLSLGILAVSLATGGHPSGEVDKASAVQELADLPLGRWLVLLVVIGLAALTIWHALMAFTGDPVRGDDTTDKARFGILTVLYGLTTVGAFRVLTDVWRSGSRSSSGSGSSGSETTASVLMDVPGGRIIVAALGLALIAFSARQLKKHTMDEKFMERLDTSPLDNRAREGVEKVGRIGYLARATVSTMVGIFFVAAAIQQNPDEAGGISQALGTLAGSVWGRLVLWLVALGLVAYGIFAFVEARFRKAA